MKKPLRSLLFALLVVGWMGSANAWAQSKVLFEAMHAQTAGNADWVLDEDTCGVAQRFPTPAQSGITSSTIMRMEWFTWASGMSPKLCKHMT